MITGAAVWFYQWGQPLPLLSQALDCETQLAHANTMIRQTEAAETRDRLAEFNAAAVSEFNQPDWPRRRDQLLLLREASLVSLQSALRHEAELELLNANFGAASFVGPTPQNTERFFDAISANCGRESLRFRATQWLWSR